MCVTSLPPRFRLPHKVHNVKLQYRPTVIFLIKILLIKLHYLYRRVLMQNTDSLLNSRAAHIYNSLRFYVQTLI